MRAGDRGAKKNETRVLKNALGFSGSRGWGLFGGMDMGRRVAEEARGFFT
jgi:hypothetical protein